MTERSVASELVHESDLRSVAEMFIAAFPELVVSRFRHSTQAVAFYHDLFSLVLAANASSFLAHREEGELAGFAAITWPSTPLMGALVQRGRWWRFVLRALRGTYGYRPRLAAATLRAFVSDRPAAVGSSRPCLYSVAVRARYEGRGIGRSLVRRAKAATKSSGLWLLVGPDARARHLYRSEGFETIMTLDARDVMLWTGQE